MFVFFFFQAEDGIRDIGVTGVQTCALPISLAQDAIIDTHAASVTTFLSACILPQRRFTDEPAMSFLRTDGRRIGRPARDLARSALQWRTGIGVQRGRSAPTVL